MTYEELVDLSNNITLMGFKPIEVTTHRDGFIMIVVKIPILNIHLAPQLNVSNAEQQTVIYLTDTKYWPLAGIGRFNEHEIVHAFRSMIQGLYLHEIDEQMTVRNERKFDPHWCPPKKKEEVA